MARKVTKKELQAKEEAQNKLRRERKQFISDIHDYWDDCAATVRYYKSHDMADKLDYYGSIGDEEATELLHKKESLKDIKLSNQYDDNDPERRVWDFIHSMIETDTECWEGEYLAMRLDADDFWINDILWDPEQIDLYCKYLKKFGYKRLVYTDSSTAAMRSIVEFTRHNMKIVGVVAKKDWKGQPSKDYPGLIFDLSEMTVE